MLCRSVIFEELKYDTYMTVLVHRFSILYLPNEKSFLYVFTLYNVINNSEREQCDNTSGWYTKKYSIYSV